MSEDELLTGLLEAAATGGWLVHHDRRSDLALTQGALGFPDLICAHLDRAEVVVIECKSEKGRVDELQDRWLIAFLRAGITSLVVRPSTYDEAVRYLVGDRLLAMR